MYQHSTKDVLTENGSIEYEIAGSVGMFVQKKYGKFSI